MPRRQSPVSWLITAEHASRRVPARWAALFAGRKSLLSSHRAWDPGSAEMARTLAETLGAPLLAGTVSRLLIDLNRSEGHPKRFSEITRALPAAERSALEREFWRPHWAAYEKLLRTLPGRIVHLACHSFTPVFDGQTRTTDLGLLYDPSRPAERAFCRELGERLRRDLPGLSVHMNRPYRGVANGMGQQHRLHHSDRRLITVEIELNQRLAERAGGLGAAVASAAQAVVSAPGDR